MKDLIGKKFGNLEVIQDIGILQKENRRRHFWLCRCVCGRNIEYAQDVLVRKKYPVKSCGCLQYRKGEQHHGWTGYGEISGNRWDCIKRERKNRRSIPFSITIEEAWDLFLTQKRKCALSGLALTFGASNKDEFTASLDRIDSSKGYTPENVQWIHKDVNWMKNEFNQEYFLKICRTISEYNAI